MNTDCNGQAESFPANFHKKYWGGANASAPIIACLGAESSLSDDDLTFFGFLIENAAHFTGLLVHIEHPYYGNPSRFSPEELKDASTLGYFNYVRAIADYAEILMYIKEKYTADNSPVIVVGASYGRMLATWFRLKYTHVALGAVASSAPILYFDDLTPHSGYYSVVTKDFRTCSDMMLPLAHGNGTMFPSENFDLDSYIKDFKDVYGVPPRPDWVATYYGGDDIKSILKRFGSNIIFSNGLKDPRSFGGILEDISESTVTVHTAHVIFDP